MAESINDDFHFLRKRSDFYAQHGITNESQLQTSHFNKHLQDKLSPLGKIPVETAFLETMEFILTIVEGKPEVYFEAVTK